MPSTTFELSDDGQMITLHGLKGRWNPDDTRYSNLEARKMFPECLACQNDKMSIIAPVAMAEWLSDSISQNPHFKYETRMRVSAYVAVMLFLEGYIYPVSLEQTYEQDGEVVIPNVRVDGNDLTLYVVRGDYSYIEAVNTRHLAMLAW